MLVFACFAGTVAILASSWRVNGTAVVDAILVG